VNPNLEKMINSNLPCKDIYSKKLVISLLFLFGLLKLMAQPVINSFSPTSGPSGTSVTILGTNFNSIAANNIVYFGAAKATVSFVSLASLTVIVPSGATYEPISITSNGLTVYSSKPFLLTFADGGNVNSSSYEPKVDFVTDLHPNSISLVDLDGDGKSDITTANNYSTIGMPASISILRNTSTGGTITFAPKQDFNNGVATYGIASGDIDGDGKKDIVASSIGDQNISVFRNTSIVGTISFATKVDLVSGNSPYSITIWDIDGNGKLDIVVVNATSNIISVYRNTSTIGNISFAPKIDFTTQNNPQALAVGDFNADNKIDIAVTNKLSNSFSIFRNTSTAGNISFAARTDIACGTGNEPKGITTGDFDGDNFTDIAIVISQSSSGNSFAQLFKNSGNFNFNFETILNGATNNNSYYIAATDINGDGKIDLALAATGINTTKVFQNNGFPTGAFNFIELNQPFSLSPYAVSSGDLNGDGRTDLITSNFTSNTISVFKNTCGLPEISSFSPAIAGTGATITIVGNNLGATTSVTVGGVATTSFAIVNSTTITAVLGTGASGNIVVTNSIGSASIAGFVFANNPVISSFSPTIGGTGSVITINGANLLGATGINFGGIPATSFTVVSSTKITAVVGAGATGSITITFPVNSVTVPNFLFTTVPIINGFAPASGQIGSTVAISGLNFSTTATNNIVYFGDVKATVTSATTSLLNVIVPAGANYKPITVTTNNKTAFSKIPFVLTLANPTNISNGSFAAKTDFALGSTGTYGVETSDLDNDGKVDFFATQFDAIKVSIFKNSSSASNISFAPKIDSSTGSYPTTVGANDYDGDGKKDLTTVGTNNVSIFKNNGIPGSILLAPKQYISALGFNKVLYVGDIIPDGKPDIVTATSSSNTLDILKNTSLTGTISFDSEYLINPGTETNSVCIGDLNDDGVTDVAAVSKGGGTNSNGTLSIYKNNSNAGTIIFDPQINLTTNVNPSSVVMGDVNGDGKLDIIVANAGFSPGVGSISIYKNTSQNGIISFASKIDYPASFGPSCVTIGDLNGDGKVDMVVVNAFSNSISLYENNSTSGSISFSQKVDIPTGTLPQHAALADFDGDGKLDIAVACYSTGAVSIHRNASNELSFNSFTPSNGTTNTLVTITGNNFTGATSVTFGGVAASSFTVVNNNTITATVGNGASGNVSVITPSGSVSKTGFTFIGLPTITSFAPTSATTNGVITISGTNLSTATSISFGGVNASSFTIVNNNSITAVVGSGNSGSVSITTTTGSASLSGFAFIPQPAINSFTPANAGTGSIVTITGSNFNGTSVVSFGGVPATSFTIVNPNTITALVGNGASGNISLTTAAGTTVIAGFNYTPQPSITSFTPNNAPLGSVVTITGTNFLGVTAVSFGSIAATSFIVINANTITAIIGNGASGDISVTTAGGITTFPGFTFTNATNNNPTDLLITPNPAISFIISKHPASALSNLKLIDLNGKLIKVVKINPNVTQTLISTIGISKGIYKLVWTDGITIIKKTIMVAQ
jgi:FG-GAP-like repeat/IPT/TIG domain